MSKLLAILLASLPILLLSKELKDVNPPSGLSITFVRDIVKYRAENPDGPWQPLDYLDDVGFVMGEENEYDLLLKTTERLYYQSINPAQPHRYRLPSESEIKYIELSFEENNNDAQAFLVGGGIGQKFVSLVVKIPQANYVNNLDVNVCFHN